MKSKVIKIKKVIILFPFLFLIFIYFIFTICIDQVEIYSFETRTVKSIAKKVQINSVDTAANIISKNTVLKEYENFPKEYKGCVVVGKIKIPKLEIEKYILEETTEENLKIAVTKTYGPKANEIGNFCISGHNYNQTFGRIKELEIGDKIIITDTYNREVTYQVYKNYKVEPTDTTCLSQDTSGEREITLITCTLGAIKRNIIKAIEIYD